jgi:hypothetical protein
VKATERLVWRQRLSSQFSDKFSPQLIRVLVLPLRSLPATIPSAPVITPRSGEYLQRERLSAFNDSFSSHCDNIPDADRIKAM